MIDSLHTLRFSPSSVRTDRHPHVESIAGKKSGHEAHLIQPLPPACVLRASPGRRPRSASAAHVRLPSIQRVQIMVESRSGHASSAAVLLLLRAHRDIVVTRTPANKRL
jgi:hypothetical protein